MEELIDHFRPIFECLQHIGLKINVDKCKFATNKLSFLGHEIDETEISPLPKKISAIQNFPQLESLRQLRRFIELSNYYQRFLP